MGRLGILAVLVGGAVALPGCRGGAVTLYEENDLFAFTGKREDRDGNYSQGLRLSVVAPTAQAPEMLQSVAKSLPIYEESETNAVAFVAGQHIYTPKNIEIEGLQKKDRPYAGWLYVGTVFAKQRVSGDDRSNDAQDTVEIDLGVTGEPSLAHDAQEQFHQTFNAKKAEGWEHQIGFEPGLILAYEKRVRAFGGENFDLIPNYGAAVGNIDTHAAAGAMARLGFNLPRDFGVQTISSSPMECSCTTGDGFSFYLFGAAEGRAVLRNVFLDGNTWRDSHEVEKNVPVAELKAGFAAQYKSLRITYSWITRSREFEGQDMWARYGSFSVGLFFDF
jgi:lipid A 3-O-deacylase